VSINEAMRQERVFDNAAKQEIRAERAEAECEYLRKLIERVHPRVWKLVDKQRDFIVIGEHEPYYMNAYAMIREHEISKGTWTEEDRVAYAAAQLSSA